MDLKGSAEVALANTGFSDNDFDGLHDWLFAPFAENDVDEALMSATDVVLHQWLVRGSSVGHAPRTKALPGPWRRWVQGFALRQGVRLDPVCGTAGGVLEGIHTFRWHAIMAPLSRDGTLLSIRRHRFQDLQISDFPGSPEVWCHLSAAMRSRRNILIVGPTGCGKTSLVAALLRHYAPLERTVLIEAIPELPLPSPCSVRLVERPATLEGIGAVSLTRLVQEALRMRPDRLVIGEIRSGEAAAFVEAMLSGHAGVMATTHGASVNEALAKLAWLASHHTGGPLKSHGLPWEFVPLTIAIMARGSPPRLVAIDCRNGGE